MEGIKQVPPLNGDVLQGIVEESEAVVERRGTVENDSGLSVLRETLGDGAGV